MFGFKSREFFEVEEAEAIQKPTDVSPVGYVRASRK
jgi:hypothetical protein